MRPILRLALVALALLLLTAPTPARPGQAARAAVGTIGTEGEGGTLRMVGGCTSPRRWVGSAHTKRLLRRGDRVALFNIVLGRVGEGVLLGAGVAGGQDRDSQVTIGASFPVEATFDAPQEEAYQRLSWSEERFSHDLVGVWHAPTSPAPRVVKARMLASDGKVYRQVILDWLREHGVREAVRRTVEVEQILRADVNGDGRQEVFLSFHTPSMCCRTHGHRVPARFSYLLMRHLPAGAKRLSTSVIHDAPQFMHLVVGLCDLDSDGWAEVITESSSADAWGATLHHWTGRRFRHVRGWRAWG